MCYACEQAMLRRGDIIKVTALNWEFYKKQHGIREGSRAVVVPHNEFYFFKEKGFFETPEEEVELRNGQKLYDVVLPNGKEIQNVGWEADNHLLLYWAHYEVTNLQPLVKMIEDFSQTPKRALSWIVLGNSPPVWGPHGYNFNPR